jgi:hypothetical protein
MRKSRSALVGPMVLVLLAGLGGPAAAQADVLEPAATTGTLEMVEPMDDAMAHDGPVEHVHTWTAADPRLTGTASYTGSWHLYDAPAEECDDPAAQAGAVSAIETDGGTWTCSGVRAPIPGPDGASNVHVLALTGGGGYEGLHAYIRVDWSTAPFTFSALITPDDVSIVPELEG